MASYQDLNASREAVEECVTALCENLDSKDASEYAGRLRWLKSKIFRENNTAWSRANNLARQAMYADRIGNHAQAAQFNSEAYEICERALEAARRELLQYEDPDSSGV